jgi:hypothetical protein
MARGDSDSDLGLRAAGDRSSRGLPASSLSPSAFRRRLLQLQRPAPAGLGVWLVWSILSARSNKIRVFFFSFPFLLFFFFTFRKKNPPLCFIPSQTSAHEKKTPSILKIIWIFSRCIFFIMHLSK